MKYSKTTLRELSAKYRSILKKCFLLNAMAMGLIVATGAKADLTIADVILSANKNETSSIFDLASGGAYYGDGSSSTIDMSSVTSIAEGDYYFDYNGSSTAVNKSTYGSTTLNKTLYNVDKSSLSATATDISGYTTLNNGKIARDSLTYTDGTATYTLASDSSGDSAAILSKLGSYTYHNTNTGGDIALNDASVSYTPNTDGTVTAGNISMDGYGFALSDATYVVDTSKNTLASGMPTIDNYQYYNGSAWVGIPTDVDAATWIASLSGSVRDSALAALDAYQADQNSFTGVQTTYNTDNTNYQIAVAGYNTTANNVNALATAYDTTYTSAYNTANDNWTASNTSYVAALDEYTTDSANFPTAYTAYTEYGGSLAKVIDGRADSVVTTALANSGDAYQTASDVATTLANGGDAYQTASGVGSAITTALANGTDPYQTASGVDSKISTALANGTNPYQTASDVATTLANGGDAYQTASAVSAAVSAATTMTDDGDSSTTLYHNFAEGSSVIAAIGSLDTAVDANTSNIAILQGDANTAGSVAKAVADEAAARNTAIATATTMGTTAGKNYGASSSVIAAIESIDTNMGKIHGLIGSDGSFNGKAGASTNMVGTTYKGNLAVGTTVEDHLVALDNTIGIMSNLTTTEKTTVVGAINEVDAKIGTTSTGTYVAAANTVGQNLNALDSALGDVRSDMASTQAANNARFAQIDSRIDKLQDKMEKGLAANNALAGLVPLDHTHKTQLSAAMGGYGSNQALAVGAFHYINDSTLLNAGVGYGGNSSMSYKVGVTFGF